MRPWQQKSRPQKLLAMVEQLLDVPDPSKFKLSRSGSGNALKVSLPQGKTVNTGVNQDTAVKAGMIAGGLVGLTAGSAGISALRRRTRGAGDDS